LKETAIYGDLWGEISAGEPVCLHYFEKNLSDKPLTSIELALSLFFTRQAISTAS